MFLFPILFQNRKCFWVKKVCLDYAPAYDPTIGWALIFFTYPFPRTRDLKLFNYHLNIIIMKPRTVRNWLNRLPEPYRSQAIANIPKGFEDEMTLELTDALIGCYWHNSPQGYDYWLKVYICIGNTNLITV